MTSTVSPLNASQHSADNGALEMGRLQKTLAGLMKKVAEVSKDHSPSGQERLALLKIQIQAVQQQIEQVQLAVARKRQTTNNDASAPVAKNHTSRPTGAIIDTNA